MCLKETICWSICLLLCFLCHCLSPINDRFRTFPCPPSLLLPNRQPGQGGCAVFGWARGWYPLVSDSHREKRGLSDMHPICTHIPYTTNEGGAAAFYSVFIYSEVGIAVLTWVHKHTDFFLCFVVFFFFFFLLCWYENYSLSNPWGPQYLNTECSSLQRGMDHEIDKTMLKC